MAWRSCRSTNTNPVPPVARMRRVRHLTAASPCESPSEYTILTTSLTMHCGWRPGVGSGSVSVKSTWDSRQGLIALNSVVTDIRHGALE